MDLSLNLKGLGCRSACCRARKGAGASLRSEILLNTPLISEFDLKGEVSEIRRS